MKNKLILSTLLTALFVVATVVNAPEVNAAPKGNAYGYYGYPGNSYYGRMHNPHFFYRWGGQSFGSIDEAVAYIREHMFAVMEQKANKKITWIETRTSSDTEVDVTTRTATNIDEESATLRGVVDLNDEEDALVWFEYGTRSSSLSERTSKTRIDEDDDEDFSKTITDLDEDTRYYFRAVVEDNGDREYGSTLSFFTDEDGDDSDDDSDEDYPEATTLTANSIDEESAGIRGSVDMNDFRNGKVFFVYGTDEDMVDDVDDYDTYVDIEEEDDDLQKFSVDTDLDSTGTYVGELRGLDDNTTYYYRIGVEFEDEDDDDTLELGTVRSFRTD